MDCFEGTCKKIDVMECLKGTCKKVDELAIKFVDSIDTTVQDKIEKNIKAGELIESRLNGLTDKQNELRDEIDKLNIEITLDNLEALVKMPVISSMIKDVFTYYYTYILDLIPSEEKEGMTDTTVDIQDLDISIKLMYCIELVCNPEDYVLNYQMNDKYNKEQHELALKNCYKTDVEDKKGVVNTFSEKKEDLVTGEQLHPTRAVDYPFGTGMRRRQVDNEVMERNGGKKTKRYFKKSKKDKKSKKAKKTKKGKKMKKTKKSNARKAKKMKKSSRK